VFLAEQHCWHLDDAVRVEVVGEVGGGFD